MSRLGSEYPERVYSSDDEGMQRRMREQFGSRGLPKGWILAGLAGVGLAAWMVWHFGPDFVRYMKMERM